MIEAGGRRPSRFLSALPFPLRRLSRGHFSRPGGHKIGQNRKGHMSMKNVKIFLLRRWYVIGSAALLAAAAIFYAVNYPAFVSTAATTRQLPIYSVERTQKVCAISFDAAWGDAKVRQFGSLIYREESSAAVLRVSSIRPRLPALVRLQPAHRGDIIKPTNVSFPNRNKEVHYGVL